VSVKNYENQWAYVCASEKVLKRAHVDNNGGLLYGATVVSYVCQYTQLMSIVSK